MRNGICNKCGEMTVHSGAMIPVKASSGNSIPIDFSHNVPLDNYICVSCGYVESYISDIAALQRIATQWPSADAVRRKRKNDAR